MIFLDFYGNHVHFSLMCILRGKSGLIFYEVRKKSIKSRCFVCFYNFQSFWRANLAHVAELGDDAVEVLIGRTFHHELDGIAEGDVLVGTHLADIVDDLLGELHLLEDLLVHFLGLGLLGDDDVVAIPALGDGMPNFLPR